MPKISELHRALYAELIDTQSRIELELNPQIKSVLNEKLNLLLNLIKICENRGRF